MICPAGLASVRRAQCAGRKPFRVCEWSPRRAENVSSLTRGFRRSTSLSSAREAIQVLRRLRPPKAPQRRLFEPWHRRKGQRHCEAEKADLEGDEISRGWSNVQAAVIPLRAAE